MKKAIGYIRGCSEELSRKRNNILAFAEEIGVSVDSIFIENTKCLYSEMKEARKISENFQDCLLIVNDTSELFQDDDAKYFLNAKFIDRNISVVDCACPTFDNFAIDSTTSKGPIDFLQNGMIVLIESYMRSVRENDCDIKEKYIQELKNRIKE